MGNRCCLCDDDAPVFLKITGPKGSLLACPPCAKRLKSINATVAITRSGAPMFVTCLAFVRKEIIHDAAV